MNFNMFSNLTLQKELQLSFRKQALNRFILITYNRLSLPWKDCLNFAIFLPIKSIAVFVLSLRREISRGSGHALILCIRTLNATEELEVCPIQLL